MKRKPSHAKKKPLRNRRKTTTTKRKRVFPRMEKTKAEKLRATIWYYARSSLTRPQIKKRLTKRGFIGIAKLLDRIKRNRKHYNSLEGRYWRKEGRIGDNGRITTKSLVGRNSKKKFKIRKKIKKLKTLDIESAQSILSLDAGKFYKLGKKPKEAFMKLQLTDESGNKKWVSKVRTTISNQKDLNGTIELILSDARNNYEEEYSITGYDFEETIQ